MCDSCAFTFACPQAHLCVWLCLWTHTCVYVCMHAYEYEPLAVIHGEHLLTGLATTERIGKKPPGALCVCLFVCVPMNINVNAQLCVCVCEVPLSHWKESRGY